jgi:hypothetical protein
MRQHRLTRSAALAAAVAALAAPTAAAQQDLRNPDTRDAAAGRLMPAHVQPAAPRHRSRPAKWWSSLSALLNRTLATLADRTRDWRRGCGL